MAVSGALALELRDLALALELGPGATAAPPLALAGLSAEDAVLTLEGAPSAGAAELGGEGKARGAIASGAVCVALALALALRAGRVRLDAGARALAGAFAPRWIGCALGGCTEVPDGCCAASVSASPSLTGLSAGG